MIPIYAAVGGTFIVVGVVVVLLIAVSFSFYTFRGSMINAHPNDGLDGAPEAKDPSQASGRGRTAEDHPHEHGTGNDLSTHGTK